MCRNITVGAGRAALRHSAQPCALQPNSRREILAVVARYRQAHTLRPWAIARAARQLHNSEPSRERCRLRINHRQPFFLVNTETPNAYVATCTRLPLETNTAPSPLTQNVLAIISGAPYRSWKKRSVLAYRATKTVSSYHGTIPTPRCPLTHFHSLLTAVLTPTLQSL